MREALLVKTGEFVSTISPQDFESIVLKAFSRQGYKVTQTPLSGDGGVDGFIEKNNEKIAVQCKKYTNIIGVQDLTAFYGAMLHFRCNKGIFVTTSDYSTSAKNFVKGKKIRLFNKIDTLKLLQSTINNEYVRNGDKPDFESIFPVIKPTKSDFDKCPRCRKGKLVPRNGRNGYFLGCSRFPKCKFTCNL